MKINPFRNYSQVTSEKKQSPIAENKEFCQNKLEAESDL